MQFALQFKHLNQTKDRSMILKWNFLTLSSITFYLITKDIITIKDSQLILLLSMNSLSQFQV